MQEFIAHKFHKDLTGLRIAHREAKEFEQQRQSEIRARFSVLDSSIRQSARNLPPAMRWAAGAVFDAEACARAGATGPGGLGPQGARAFWTTWGFPVCLRTAANAQLPLPSTKTSGRQNTCENNVLRKQLAQVFVTI